MPSAGKTLFTSDIHLDSENSVITHSFLDFLENRAKGAEALYVLGDLLPRGVIRNRTLLLYSVRGGYV